MSPFVASPPIELAPDAAWAEHAPSKCVMTAVLARCRPAAPRPFDWRTACSDWRRRELTGARATAQSFPASPAIRPDTRPLHVGLTKLVAGKLSTARVV